MDGLSGVGSGTYSNTGSGFSDGMGSGMDYNGKRFIGGASAPNTALGPGPSWWERAASWLTDRFSGRGAGITTTLSGATVSRVGTVEVGPVKEERYDAWFIISTILLGSPDPYSAIGNSGVGPYAEERETAGAIAMILVNPEAAAEGLERKVLSKLQCRKSGELAPVLELIHKIYLKV